MKFTNRTSTFLLLAVLLFSGMSWAQRGNLIIRADIPFEFTVGNHLLPAGVYTVERVNTYTLAIHDARKHVVATVLAMPAETLAPPTTAKLQFYTGNDGRTTLGRVWTSNSRYGYELSAQKTRTVLARTETTPASAGR